MVFNLHMRETHFLTLRKVVDLFEIYIDYLLHVTVLSIRLSLSSVFQEKLFEYLFSTTANDYIICHVTSYLSKYAEHSPSNKP